MFSLRFAPAYWVNCIRLPTMRRGEQASNSSLSLYAFLRRGVQEILPGTSTGSGQISISAFKILARAEKLNSSIGKLEQRDKRREALGSLTSASSTAST
jgi:hypothetical protein